MSPIIVLIPVFNDWESLEMLLRDLDLSAASQRPIRVVVVDDGSTDEAPASFPGDAFSFLESIEIVRLRRNLGHQRAICVGLVHVHDRHPGAITVLMDGDGEDKPSDILRLLEKCESGRQRTIVFAERTKRSESLLFRTFYALFKAIHFVFTGIRVRVGNFSAIPYESLSSLVVVSEIWNHYAAAVYNARLPHESVPTSRGKRYAGKSRMNFVSLIIHGLSAISVYSDRVGVRLLALSAVMIAFVILGVAATVVVKFYTTLAIAGWATYVIGILLVLLMQAVSMSFVFAFITLNGRSRPSFLPLRDCPYFVGSVRTVYGRDAV
jgi:glycosyltransferase involved in cell wall biosynthesis